VAAGPPSERDNGAQTLSQLPLARRCFSRGSAWAPRRLGAAFAGKPDGGGRAGGAPRRRRTLAARASRQTDWFEQLPRKHRSSSTPTQRRAPAHAMLFANNYFVANKSLSGSRTAISPWCIAWRHQSTLRSRRFNDAMWARSDGRRARATRHASQEDPKTSQAPDRQRIHSLRIREATAELWHHAEAGAASAGRSPGGLSDGDAGERGRPSRRRQRQSRGHYNELVANLVGERARRPGGHRRRQPRAGARILARLRGMSANTSLESHICAAQSFLQPSSWRVYRRPSPGTGHQESVPGISNFRAWKRRSHAPVQRHRRRCGGEAPRLRLESSICVRRAKPARSDRAAEQARRRRRASRSCTAVQCGRARSHLWIAFSGGDRACESAGVRALASANRAAALWLVKTD